jgi:hypothetical protein
VFRVANHFVTRPSLVTTTATPGVPASVRLYVTFPVITLPSTRVLHVVIVAVTCPEVAVPCSVSTPDEETTPFPTPTTETQREWTRDARAVLREAHTDWQGVLDFAQCLE